MPVWRKSQAGGGKESREMIGAAAERGRGHRVGGEVRDEHEKADNSELWRGRRQAA